MANFGFQQLAVVAAFAPNWREARSAVGAPELLVNARECDTLAEAVASSTLVVGTGTLTHRKPDQRVVALPNLPAIVRDELRKGGRVALVFGPEKHGLTRNDLSYCHLMVEIPTDYRQPSMNLGQAAAVCLYELSVGIFRQIDESKAAPGGDGLAPSSGALELLACVIEETMDAAGYSPRTMLSANRHDLRVLLRRLQPNQLDTRRMLGLFRRILWRLRHASK